MIKNAKISEAQNKARLIFKLIIAYLEINAVSICYQYKYLIDTTEIIHDFIIIYVTDKVRCCKIT